MQSNPYQVTSERIMEPPTTFWGRLRHLGPGLILSASIVGSGELIATTLFGAEVGFVALWVILISCLVKVTIQLEFGKHAIHSGESTMASWNKLPGPKLGRANWTVWTWLGLMLFKNLQLGGIIGGVAVIMNMILPIDGLFSGLGDNAVLAARGSYCVLLGIVVSLLIFRGVYRFIERVSVFLIAFFVLFTLAAVISMQFTEHAFSFADIASGFQFNLPGSQVALIAAIGAFGITGVGGDEIMAYNYWLVEKGYAAFAGPRDDSEAWLRRARGWIRTMYIDALVSMVVYTLMTIGFFILGASVLHGTPDLPSSPDLVPQLARMYTDTLGTWAHYVFLGGAFVVLFSTLFAALAAWTRQFSDAFGQIGWINFKDSGSRMRTIGILAWVFPLVWTVVYVCIQKPGLMVQIGGGLVTTIILLIVVFAACWFRYRRLPSSLHPSRFYDLCFWTSVIAIAGVALQALWKTLQIL